MRIYVVAMQVSVCVLVYLLGRPFPLPLVSARTLRSKNKLNSASPFALHPDMMLRTLLQVCTYSTCRVSTCVRVRG